MNLQPALAKEAGQQLSIAQGKQPAGVEAHEEDVSPVSQRLLSHRLPQPLPGADSSKSGLEGSKTL